MLLLSKAREVLEPSYWEGLRENPAYVVFNGREGALTEQPLLTEQGDRLVGWLGVEETFTGSY